ncbi:hypothetical protein GALL_328160 [mine drainage metagenome]|uniref:Uncharacterized protein n=1 Tax=mine drainage metagenome TaxID=410659 RepID=A0A1J5QPM7_9ZZZZ
MDVVDVVEVAHPRSACAITSVRARTRVYAHATRVRGPTAACAFLHSRARMRVRTTSTTSTTSTKEGPTALSRNLMPGRFQRRNAALTRPANLVGNLWMFPKTYIHKHPQHPQFSVGNGRSQSEPPLACASRTLKGLASFPFSAFSRLSAVLGTFSAARACSIAPIWACKAAPAA